MSDGLTIWLLFPDLSRRTFVLAGLVSIAWAGTLAGINASGLSAGGSLAIQTRAASCIIDAAFHFTVLSARAFTWFRNRVRSTYTFNSAPVLLWRLATAILVLSDEYQNAYAGK